MHVYLIGKSAREQNSLADFPTVYLVFYPSIVIKKLADINTSAPPSLVAICANGISPIRSDADNTAIFPVPPILFVQSPAVIAASTG